MSDEKSKIKAEVMGEPMQKFDSSKLSICNSGPQTYSLNFFTSDDQPKLVFKTNDEGKVEVIGEMTDDAMKAMAKFVDHYNSVRTKELMETAALRSMIPAILKALKDTMPQFGTPGSRDVDVSYRRDNIQRTIDVLAAYLEGNEDANSLLEFYDWCVDRSSSPGDRYHNAWAAVNTYLKRGEDQ